MIKILLTCATGASSHQFADRMNEAAKKNKVDCSVDACAESTLTSKANQFDVILVGPQFRYKTAEIKEIAADKAPVVELEIEDFNILNVEKVVEKAVAAYQNFHK